MLPFLKKRDEGGATNLIVKTREPDQKPEQDQDDSTDAIEYCVRDLINAIHMKDSKAAAQALKDCFDVLDSQPHEEGSHIEPHSYDAQNIKAGSKE